MRMCMYICLCVCVYVHTCVYVCVYLYVYQHAEKVQHNKAIIHFNQVLMNIPKP